MQCIALHLRYLNVDFIYIVYYVELLASRHTKSRNLLFLLSVAGDLPEAYGLASIGFQVTRVGKPSGHIEVAEQGEVTNCYSGYQDKESKMEET
jgi:hypothetical protein